MKKCDLKVCGSVLVGGVITSVSLLSPAGRGKENIEVAAQKAFSASAACAALCFLLPQHLCANSQTFTLTFDADVRSTLPRPRPSDSLAHVATSLYRTSSAVYLPDVCRAQPLLHGSLGLPGTSPVTRRLLESGGVLDATAAACPCCSAWFGPTRCRSTLFQIEVGSRTDFSSVSPEHFVQKQKQMMINGGSQRAVD